MDHGPLVQTDGETIPVEYLNDRGMPGRNLRKIEKGSFTKYLLGEEVHLGGMIYSRVLFVGEANFTFSVAFAALRKVRSGSDKPWNGIISTCLGAELPTFSRTKVQCIATSFKYHNQVKNHLDKELQDLGLASDIGISGDTHLLLKIRALLDLPPPPPQYHHLYWRPNIDALEPLNIFDVIWFQCPWVHPGSVADLVEGFMLNAAHNTSESQRVCLGITTCRAYVHRYELERILGENLRGEDGSTATLQKFHFLGADTELIAKILSYGYHHHSDSGKDIHNLILPHHVTLVFQRKKDRRR